MPFGPYSGTPLAVLSEDYLQGWLKDERLSGRDLARAMDRELGRRSGIELDEEESDRICAATPCDVPVTGKEEFCCGWCYGEFKRRQQEALDSSIDTAKSPDDDPLTRDSSLPTEEKARKKLKKQFREWAVPKRISPDDALTMVMEGLAGQVSYFQKKLEEQGGIGGGRRLVKLERRTKRGTTEVYEVRASLLYELLQEARRDLADVASKLAKANVAERRVELQESQAQLLADVVRGILRDLGVSESPKTIEVVRRHMLAAGEAVEEAVA